MKRPAKRLKAALVAAHDARWVLRLLDYTPEKEARRRRRALDAARYARHVLRHTPPELLVGFLGPDATAEDREFVILNLAKS